MKSVFGGRHQKTDFFLIFCIFSIEYDNGGTRGEPGVLGRSSPEESEKNPKKILTQNNDNHIGNDCEHV